MSITIDTGITENDLLDELTADAIPRYDPSIHVTVQAYAERTGLTETNALTQLDKKLKDSQGKLKKIRVRRKDGYVVVAFVRA